MPILRELAVIVPITLAMLFACTLLESDETRFESALYASVTYAPHSKNEIAPARYWHMQEVTPAGRVNSVFGQFVSHGARRGVRS